MPRFKCRDVIDFGRKSTRWSCRRITKNGIGSSSRRRRKNVQNDSNDVNNSINEKILLDKRSCELDFEFSDHQEDESFQSSSVNASSSLCSTNESDVETMEGDGTPESAIEKEDDTLKYKNTNGSFDRQIMKVNDDLNLEIGRHNYDRNVDNELWKVASHHRQEGHEKKACKLQYNDLSNQTKYHPDNRSLNSTNCMTYKDQVEYSQKMINYHEQQLKYHMKQLEELVRSKKLELHKPLDHSIGSRDDEIEPPYDTSQLPKSGESKVIVTEDSLTQKQNIAQVNQIKIMKSADTTSNTTASWNDSSVKTPQLIQATLSPTQSTRSLQPQISPMSLFPSRKKSSTSLLPSKKKLKCTNRIKKDVNTSPQTNENSNRHSRINSRNRTRSFEEMNVASKSTNSIYTKEGKKMKVAYEDAYVCLLTSDSENEDGDSDF